MNGLPEILISASILSADFAHLENEVKQAEKAGVDWIHIDVMDGHFVPNITMGPFIVETIRHLTNLPLDVHLMIEKPELHIKSFNEAGANKITLHYENNPNIHRTLQEIRLMGIKPGIAINPGTPPGNLESVLGFVDMVLVMTVNPGYSGQELFPEMIEKVKRTSDLLCQKNQQVLLQVDGGVRPSNINLLFHAGARVFVAASSIFRHPQGIQEGVFSLRKAVI